MYCAYIATYVYMYIIICMCSIKCIQGNYKNQEILLKHKVLGKTVGDIMKMNFKDLVQVRTYVRNYIGSI